MKVSSPSWLDQEQQYVSQHSSFISKPSARQQQEKMGPTRADMMRMSNEMR